MKRVLPLSVTCIVSIWLSGCASSGSYQSSRVHNQPMFSQIIDKTITYQGIHRNPVIVIHGFLGAKLDDNDSGEPVWGTFTGIQNLTSGKIRSLSHPMATDRELRELQSASSPAGLLDRVHIRLLGFSFYLSAYDNLIEVLTDSGYVRENSPLPKDKKFYSLFVFYYDWRRDLSENAAKLHRFILERRDYIREQYRKHYQMEDYDVHFDIVAHSMGGLLTRYYLRYGDQELADTGPLPLLDWRGCRYIDKAAIIGAPNSGYLDTLMELLNGLELAPGAPLYPPGLIGTFPVYYQMLPETDTRSVLYRDKPDGDPIDLFDPEIWRKHEWGLLSPGQDGILRTILPEAKNRQERVDIALDHLRKCLKRARRFRTAMRIAAAPPPETSLALFAGNAAPTSRTAMVNRRTGKVEVAEYESGDGKVLLSSAIMDEREGREWTPLAKSPIHWNSVLILRGTHLGIINNPEFIDNLRYFLLGNPRRHSATTTPPAEK